METQQPPVAQPLWADLERRVVLPPVAPSSPVHLLASSFFPLQETPSLVLITGGQGAGKSRLCQELATQARAYGLNVGGLISPAVFAGEQKVAIDLVDLGSSSQRRLATRRSRQDSPGIETEHWRFDADTLAWGESILHQLPAVDVLIIDELGPLEFEQQAGWQSGMALLDRRAHRLALVVIRPSLLPLAAQRWPWGRVVNVEGITGSLP